MAQTDNIHRENSIGQRIQNPFHFKRSKDQTSPTFQQLLQRDGSKWSRIPLHKQKNDHCDEDNGNYNTKKSVLAKVRETAKKFKISLSRKKSHNENESQSPSIAHGSGVGQHAKRDEDAEYHSTQIYGSKDKPETNKQAQESIPEKHSATSNTKLSKYEPAGSSNPLTGNQTKHYAPSQTLSVSTDPDTKNKEVATTNVPKVHDFPERNSRFLGLEFSTLETSHSKSDTVEKSLSVKEYLMNKFEPGEDERALSKVITQTISPRRDKVREAMGSFLKNEEPADKNVNVNFKSKSMPASNNTGSKIAYIKPSYSLGSSSSKTSSNQTFKSSFATYQNHFLGSSSKPNQGLNLSTSSSRFTSQELTQSSTRAHLNAPDKTSKSPLDHESGAEDPVSSADQTRAPRHTGTSVRRVHVSSAYRNRVQSHTVPTADQTRVPDQIDANETRSSIATGNQG